MKSIMTSVSPYLCEKITNGQCKMLVRKSAPKEVPFKCYIYCCKDNAKEIVLLKDYKNRFSFGDYRNADGHFYDVANRTVIGEFICDKVDKYTFSSYKAEYRVNHIEQEMMCLNHPDLIRYGKGKTLYGWHISGLKIYDKPKALSEFYRPCSYSGICYSCNRFRPNGTPNDKPNDFCDGEITRPPQSYMHVKEICL